MIHSIHGTNRAVDTYTGWVFDSAIRFQIPKHGGGWEGSYSVPSTALTALSDKIAAFKPPLTKAQISELEKTGTPRPVGLTADQANQLYALFQASLVKNDPENKYPRFEILKAHKYTYLAAFGGQQTEETYKGLIQYDIQRAIYRQEISGSNPIKGKNKKHNVWNHCMITPKGVTESVPYLAPRCIKSFIKFVAEFTPQRDDGKPKKGAVVLYWDRSKNILMFGDPADHNDIFNRPATQLLAGRPSVWGGVNALSLNPIPKVPVSAKRPAEPDAESEDDPDSGSDDDDPVVPPPAKVQKRVMIHIKCPEDKPANPNAPSGPSGA